MIGGDHGQAVAVGVLERRQDDLTPACVNDDVARDL